MISRRVFLAGTGALALVRPFKISSAAESQPVARLLAYGDSNTWGYRPVAGDAPPQRYLDGERWTGVLAQALGPAYQVATNGLMARTLDTDLPSGIGGLSGEDHNGLRRLPPALLAEGPVHAVIVMLGTNDTMAALGRSPAEIASGVAGYADSVERLSTVHAAVRGARLLVVAPPPLGDTAGSPFRDDFDAGSARKVLELAPALAEASRQAGVRFAKAADWIHTDGVDGIHLSASSHRSLGLGLARYVASAWRQA
jgi:lysophospholipase L1-like esterase